MLFPAAANLPQIMLEAAREKRGCKVGQSSRSTKPWCTRERYNSHPSRRMHLTDARLAGGIHDIKHSHVCNA
jgi:hypothetical protein